MESKKEAKRQSIEAANPDARRGQPEEASPKASNPRPQPQPGPSARSPSERCIVEAVWLAELLPLQAPNTGKVTAAAE